MFTTGRTPTRTLTIPNAQVREIVKRVMSDARVQHAMNKNGASRATVEKSVMQKLGSITMKKTGDSARVRELERKLSQANPVEAVAIRRALAFAKLEGGAK